MAEIITDPNLRKFVHTNVGYDFGLTVQQVAEKCKSYGRFSAWLNSDVSRIIDVLNVVKSNGVSPAFFASYERTEGYNSSWGWLNHTSVNGTPLNDADSVSKWVKTQSNNTTDNPAWIDFANYNDFVPNSVKVAGNSDFANMPSGTIGKVVISGTAAATWEVYYPQGLLKEYNGVQNYGKPITNMMNYIISWGGTITGGVGEKPCFPTSPESVITSQWGWRILNGEDDFHAGTDFASPSGTSQPIYATQSGIVIQSGWLGSAGNCVTIKHTGDPYYSRYMHMVNLPIVSLGETVSKCQKIGDTGNTGNSFGIHLHFEIAPSEDGFGKTGNTIDPELYLEMVFGGGGEVESGNKLISLLLCDALNGWKY